MCFRMWRLLGSLAAVSGVLVVSVALSDDTASSPPEGAKNGGANAPIQASPEGTSLSIEAARERAKLVHNIYEATLDVMHHRYFLDDRSTIPARAMEDIFAQIARQSQISARWFAVNAKAMSIDHKPQGDFENAAVRALSKGKEEFEKIENDVYLRAEGIPLTAGCLSCHGTFGVTSTSERIVGLAIRIPLTKKK